MTSADSTLVVAELRSGPCTFLITSADSALVVAELKSGPCTFLLELGQVLTLP